MKQERTYPRVEVTRKAENSIKIRPSVDLPHRTGGGRSRMQRRRIGGHHQPTRAVLGHRLFHSHSKIRVRLLSTNANDRFDEAFWGAPPALCLGIPQDGDGGRPRLLPGYLWGGGFLPRPDGGPIQRHPGHTDAQPGRGAAEIHAVPPAGPHPPGGRPRHPRLSTSATTSPSVSGKAWSKTRASSPWTAARSRKARRPKLWRMASAIWWTSENGQKTGFFLDQKYNRQAVARLSRGKRVLDCFTHTGSFGLNAAKGGAAHVRCVDISESAVDMARENACRNGLLDRMDFEAANVFDLLPSLPCGSKSDYDFGDPGPACVLPNRAKRWTTRSAATRRSTSAR